MAQRIVYGAHPVLELVVARPKQVNVVYLAAGATGPAIAKLREACQGRGVTVEERERGELDALAGSDARHQGVVAITGEFDYVDVHALLDDVLARTQAPLFVVLDGVQDPHNLGAIVRSAYVLGAHGVVIPKDRAAPVTPAAVKASAGATELLPIAQVTNLVRTLEELKARQIWTVAAVAREAQRPWEVDWRGSIALVLGAEGKGLRRLVEKTCDFRVAIPMVGQVASLNVSVAAGILLYEAARQRVGSSQ